LEQEAVLGEFGSREC